MHTCASTQPHSFKHCWCLGPHSCKCYGCLRPHSCEHCKCLGHQSCELSGCLVSTRSLTCASIMGALSLTHMRNECTCLRLPQNHLLFPSSCTSGLPTQKGWGTLIYGTFQVYDSKKALSQRDSSFVICLCNIMAFYCSFMNSTFSTM